MRGWLVAAGLSGAMGAAISVSLAFAVESTLIFLIAKYRLGVHLFVFGGGRS